jgi:hypothetical protein
VLLLVEDGVVDVRPELPEQQRDSIDAAVESPALAGLGPGALGAWIVGVGDAGGASGADDLAEVESTPARVGASDQEPGDGVTGTL